MKKRVDIILICDILNNVRTRNKGSKAMKTRTKKVSAKYIVQVWDKGGWVDSGVTEKSRTQAIKVSTYITLKYLKLSRVLDRHGNKVAGA